MYIINRDSNRINPLERKTFSELNIRERDHLQEWIANNPECLGEELLVIQKEFAGFNDTKERLDLLALDKQGNLVIIENKLDDSGRDVTWQAIKYASYCSNLSKADIIRMYQSYLGSTASAEENLSDFYEGTEIDELLLNEGTTTQRMILVAAKFRKEVTSSILWLLNHNLRVQCFKVTPYTLDESTFLNLEQILPIRDAEDFSIHMASKAQDELATKESMRTSHKLRLDFWSQFLNTSNEQNKLFTNISPSKSSWIGTGVGFSGVAMNLVVSRKYARTEIYINRGSKTKNKELFDVIFAQKEVIENSLGYPLEWERMDDKVSCRIKRQLEDVSLYETDDWPDMIEFLIRTSYDFEHAFKDSVKRMKKFASKQRTKELEPPQS